MKERKEMKRKVVAGRKGEKGRRESEKEERGKREENQG